MKVIAVLPARLASTRFPEKVLARRTGKYLIHHSWEQAKKAKLPERVIIAADDAKIKEAADSFGAECVLTDAGHNSGTDRIAEAVADMEAEIVVNVQADEPEVDPGNIDLAAKLLVDNPEYRMSTLVCRFDSADQIGNPNMVKVLVDAKGRALYFSRCAVPFDREADGIGPLENYLRHIGIYGYRKDFLLDYAKMPSSGLERLEKLEQLRAIENGFSIITGEVKHICEGIDTETQYEAFVARYREKAQNRV